jgi:hypothetical protein
MTGNGNGVSQFSTASAVKRSYIMLRGAGIRIAQLPFELLTSTCTKPTLHRFFTAAARSPKFGPRSGAESTHARSREGTNKEKSSDKPTYKRLSSTHTTRHTLVMGERPKRLLQPHVLSQRLKKLCEEGQLEAAIDTLKNAPLGAQSTPVWNTLIWEVLKVQRWNLSYKLYTDVSRTW